MPRISILAAVITLWFSSSAAADEAVAPQGGAAEEVKAWPWAVPVSGDFVLGPRAGYSTGSQIDGANVGVDTRFMFRHGFIGLGVNSTFLADGVCYALGVEGAGALGPLYAGASFNLHWFPGFNFGQAISLGLKAGALVLTPFEGIWIDLGYRVHFGVADLHDRIFHVFGVALVFRVPG